MEENRPWKAKWIWAEGDEALPGADVVQTVLFRRSFDVPEASGLRLTVRVSADSRYRLWINGQPASYGPCKGDVFVHYYETVDLTGLLRSGVNTLAARVVRYPAGGGGPASVWRSGRGAFLLEGQLTDETGDSAETLDTGRGWRALRLAEEAFGLQRENFTLFIGGGERVDGSLWPDGWQRPDYDDAAWPEAAVVSDTHDRFYGGLTPWQLAPRPIPAMREKDGAFARVVRGEISGRKLDGCAVPAGGSSGIAVQAGGRLRLELDAGELVAGFPRLFFSGGKGAAVSILHAECYEYPPGPGNERNKGVRDDPEGKDLYGFTDDCRLAGHGARRPDDWETYEPFHRRAFRFIRVTVEAADEPVVLEAAAYRRIGYPLEIKAHFACSAAAFDPLWTISLNTLRNCMHETYEDTPYYEQMQYEMDSRLQALFTYYVSGDDRLARKAIFDFHSSLTPSGMLQSRYPSVDRQIIPGFALFWIMMVHDHYLFMGDLPLVRKYRATIDAVLAWFGDRVEPSGLVGRMPEAYWSFVDWTTDWKDNAGAPPAGRSGPLTVYNLMYADALMKAAELNEATGRRDTAAEYRNRANGIRSSVHRLCWSEDRQLFRDGPGAEAYSQHAQIWAILTETVAGGQARRLAIRTMEGEGLAKVSCAMAFYLFRALAKTGLYGRSFSLWEAWHEQVELHLTSWVEDPVSERSDCHAWGAVPLFEFPAEILGIKPLGPGFASIRVEPSAGPLESAAGEIMTPQGKVGVSWSVRDGRFRLQVDGPAGVPVHAVLPNGDEVTVNEPGPILLDCSYEPDYESKEGQP